MWTMRSGGRPIRWMRVGILSMGSVTAMIAITTIAPVARAQAIGPTLKDSLAIVAAAEEADTGRMMPAYRDIARYNTPGYCLAGAHTLNSQSHRRNEYNLVQEGEAGDTAATVARGFARRCAARLPSVTNVASIELQNFMRLALFIGDTALFRSVIERKLSLEKTGEGRGFVLFDAIASIVGRDNRDHPIDMAPALVLEGRLDSLGPSAAAPRMEAHMMLRAIAEQVRFDTAALMREDRAIRATEQILSPTDRLLVRFAGGTFTDSTILAWYRHDPNLSTTVRGYLERSLTRLMRQNPNAGQGLQGSIEMTVAVASQVGTTAPQLTGTFWFPKDTPRNVPAPGTLTLLVLVDKGNGMIGYTPAVLLRLYQRFGSQGLNIVMVTRTQGYSWSSPPQSLENEAKTTAWYFHEYLKLPFPLVVYETKYGRDEFGERVDQPIEYLRQYPFDRALVGTDGRVYTTGIGTQSESQLQAFIAKALSDQQPSAVSQR